MAHYAKVLDGKVIQVIVAEPEFFNTFVDSSPGEWVQTSYNTHGGIYYTPNTTTPDPDQSKALRKNYAGVGYSYDRENDAFIPPKPFPSWTLDSFSFLWNPPIPMPTESGPYRWDEDSQQWILITT